MAERRTRRRFTVEMIRHLKVVRDTAVEGRTAARVGAFRPGDHRRPSGQPGLTITPASPHGSATTRGGTDMRKLLLAMALALAGCEHEPTTQEFANACQGYGFHPDTPEMAQCIQRETLAWR